jgi:hypothetical protein
MSIFTVFVKIFKVEHASVVSETTLVALALSKADTNFGKIQHCLCQRLCTFSAVRESLMLSLVLMETSLMM